jgi:hypothetical protein
VLLSAIWKPTVAACCLPGVALAHIAAGILDLGPVLMLALAFINTAGLLMLAFDFTSYGEQIEARERSRDG